MSQRIHNDNIYPEGSTITAKVRPEVNLTIVSYYHRIYYCAVNGDAEAKQLAYFERELIAPVA